MLRLIKLNNIAFSGLDDIFFKSKIISINFLSESIASTSYKDIVNSSSVNSLYSSHFADFTHTFLENVTLIIINFRPLSALSQMDAYLIPNHLNRRNAFIIFGSGSRPTYTAILRSCTALYKTFLHMSFNALGPWHVSISSIFLALVSFAAEFTGFDLAIL